MAVKRAALLLLVVLLAQVTAGDEVLERMKRHLTTICVEIRPSGPKDEPYFMCKGADFPAFKQETQPQAPSAAPGGYVAPQYAPGGTSVPSQQQFTHQTQPATFAAHSNVYKEEAANVPHGYTNFQAPIVSPQVYNNFQSPNVAPTTTPAKTYEPKYQPFPAADGGSFYSNPSSKFISNEFNAFQKQQQQPKANFPNYPIYEASTIKPSYATTQSPAAKLINYESAFESGHEMADQQTPAPSKAYAPRPSSSFGASNKETSPHSVPKTPPANAAYSHPYKTQAAAAGEQKSAKGSAHASAPTYRLFQHQQQQTNRDSGPSAHSYTSPSAATPTGADKGSSAAKASAHAVDSVGSKRTFQPAAGTATAAYRSPYMASAMAKSAAGSLRNNVAPAAALGQDDVTRVAYNPHETQRFGSNLGYRLSQFNPENSAFYPAAPHVGRIAPSPPPSPRMPAAGRYRVIELEDEVFGPNNLGFSPEEFEHLPAALMPKPEDPFGTVMEPNIPHELQPRVPYIPEEHWDDPVMRTFYSSLLDVPFLAAPPAENPLQKIDFQVASPHSRFSQTAPTVPIMHAPRQSQSRSCADTSLLSASQDHVAASDTDASYMSPGAAVYNCKPSCAAQPAVQPIFISLPCYGQQSGSSCGYAPAAPMPNYVPSATQQTSNSYETVGMPGPFGLMGPNPFGFGLFNMGLNPFKPMGLGLLGMVNPVRGLANPNLGAPNPNLLQMRAPQLLGVPSFNQGFASPILGSPNPSAQPQPTPAQARDEPSGIRQFFSNMFGKTDHTPTTTTVAPSVFPLFTEEPQEQNGKDGSGSDSDSDSIEDEEEVQEKTRVSTTSTTSATPTKTTVAKNASNKSKMGSTTETSPSVPIPTEVTEKLPPLEEESLKTYKSLIQTARSFSHIAKREGDEVAADNAAKGDHMVKRQNAKAATGAKNYKRKYAQKL